MPFIKKGIKGTLHFYRMFLYDSCTNIILGGFNLTNGGRKSSGILATIGGSLAILFSLGIMGFPGSSLWFLILGFAGLTGGVLLLCDIMAGGIIALIAGSIGIFFTIVFLGGLSDIFAIFLVVSHTMALSSGITGIASGSEL